MPCYKDEKTGTWYCQFRYTDFTGAQKQKRKRGFKTRREAQEWEREFHLQKAKSCDMTLASFVELYFNDREHHVRDTTMDTKRNIFDTKIVPLLGNRKMNEITALDIRDWQQRVKEMGEATGLPYAETYLYTIHAQLTALFNYAQTFYGLQFNPCDAAGYMGSSVAGEMLIITKDQYEILRKEFRNEAYLLAFDILFWTGCREGEMLALLPKDLTDDDQLRIYKTYHRKKGQDILGPTKNSKKGGNRNVPIPHWLAEEFRTYCSKLYGLTPDDRVFYMTCTALNKELTRCTQLTYLPDIRVHDLRHPYVKHTTKIFSLRLMDFQAQAYPDARRKTRGACQLHRGGQSRSPVRPLCNRKQFSCLLPQSKMSWILYAISMRLSGYTSTRSISSSASSVVSVSASKIALDASLRLSCRACSSCFCFTCANTAA